VTFVVPEALRASARLASPLLVVSNGGSGAIGYDVRAVKAA